MSDTKKLKVRFAPSPSGELHLGGARTALFNFLFAKHHGGQFYLRIEDTDKVRSKKEYVDQICDAMQWMGLHWDGELMFQSARSAAYHDAIQQLLEHNLAYRCFCSKDVLEKARKAGVYQYSGTCRDLDDEALAKHMNSGEDFVVRLKVPDGSIDFKDLIYGSVHVENEEIDDFIIARSSGQPTYNLTAVVDDHEMGISHIIRGDDHLSNTPKQILLYKALGMPVPEFAHLPMILGQDKKRLSKRHGAPGVQNFKDKGFLPEALLNYLALLGWNPGTEQEIFTIDEMISIFDLEQINKKGAVYDEQKMSWICGQHIMRLGTANILDGIHALDPNWGKERETHYLYSILEQLKQRSRSLYDFIDQSAYFFNDPDEYDEKSSKKNWSDDRVTDLITRYKTELESIEEWTSETVETALRKIANEQDVSAGKLIHPTRLALSGIPSGPSLFAMMELLGKDVCIHRINNALDLFPISS